MNYTNSFPNFRLVSRNEGKIKSYDSCCDLRSWSHDVGAKDRYLREWMKCSMPLYVIPVSTLTNFIRTMTCSNHRRVPRCHPECKSKVLVESICNSCHAIRECFEVNDFDTYIVEEELESSQWPCDRCLDALKSIKMFWKIIVDKIFHVNIPKSEESNDECSDRDTVRCVARKWQSEIVSQAYYVKSMTTPAIGGAHWPRAVKKNLQQTAKSLPSDDRYSEKKMRLLNLARLQKLQEEKDDLFKGFSKKFKDRGTHAAATTVNRGCDICFVEKEQDDLSLYKRDLLDLHTKCMERADEIERLRSDNKSLRNELENVYSSDPWGALSYSIPHRSTTFQPFELEESSQAIKNLDSEMLITMKQCKNENFKHVSMLQVLHKSNEPNNEPNDVTSGKKDDPIDILKKVQHTFGAIVKRELSINMNRLKKQVSEVGGSLYTVNTSTSAPSCCTLCSKLSSELVFPVECWEFGRHAMDRRHGSRELVYGDGSGLQLAVSLRCPSHWGSICPAVNMCCDYLISYQVTSRLSSIHNYISPLLQTAG